MAEYKLTKIDRFKIEELIEKVWSFKGYEDIKTSKNIIFNNQSNYNIALFIKWLLNLWDTNISNSYKPITEREKELYEFSKNIIDTLLLEDINIVTNNDLYFSKSKIDEFKNISNQNFDLSKIIRILEEVNICYQNECYLWVSSLLRMLLDHIPPTFWKPNFESVVAENNFSKSDKENMKHLLWSSKNISSWILHGQISWKEVLPNKTTIEFRPDFDILLKNIIIKLNNK